MLDLHRYLHLAAPPHFAQRCHGVASCGVAVSFELISTTWTPKVCRRIAFYGYWAIILPTLGGLGNDPPAAPSPPRHAHARDIAYCHMGVSENLGVPYFGVLLLMVKILHYLKDPKPWELRYIPYYG